MASLLTPPISTSATPAPCINSKTSTAEVLERISKAMFSDLNTKAPGKHLLQHGDRQILCISDMTRLRTTPESQLVAVYAFQQKFPTWRFRPWNASSVVDEDAGLATVWCCVTLEGYSLGCFEEPLARERVVQMKWKRKGDGKWKLVENWMLDGAGRMMV